MSEELRALLWAIVQEGAASQPGPDGAPAPEIQAKMQKMAEYAGKMQGGAALAIEPAESEFAFGTEPPGLGWEYVGDMKWARRDGLPTGEAMLIDVKAVAAKLDCSESHVNRLADDGLMPPPRKLGALVRWSRQELLDWIATGCPESEKKEEPKAEEPHVLY